ncbi:hypothetical protein JB92DRAFT_3116429 [Gautieria morchelliformis]|nr:hypothetical protein JB92DRAFT_3116429 [Gautieria morchelliformis]
MASDGSALLSLLIERARTSVKVRPDFQGELREEVEQWVIDEGIQAELRTAMHVEAIVDPSFEHPSDVDDLLKEVKPSKEWLESLVFTLSPAFLDSEVAAKAAEVDGAAVKGSEGERSSVGKVVVGERAVVKEAEVEGSTAREPKDTVIVIKPPVTFSESSRSIPTTQAVRTKRRLMFLLSDDEHDDALTPKKARMDSGSQPAKSPSPEIVAIEPTPAQRRKGRANALVAESDKVPQSVAKQGYPDHAYLLGWKIYIGPKPVIKSAKCGRCLRYNHTCSGLVRKMCGQCIRDKQGCVLPEEYEVKEEKDAREGEAKSKGKGKVEDKSSAVGHPSISSKGILGTRMSTMVGEEKVEELVERSEDLMRNVSVKLNEFISKTEHVEWGYFRARGSPSDY